MRLYVYIKNIWGYRGQRPPGAAPFRKNPNFHNAFITFRIMYKLRYVHVMYTIIVMNCYEYRYDRYEHVHNALYKFITRFVLYVFFVMNYLNSL